MYSQLTTIIDTVERVKNDRFNPETFIISRKVSTNDMVFSYSYLLGNLYIKGAFDDGEFEIFKDHATWQVWIWGEKKPDRCQFSCPEHGYDKVKHFIETTFPETK